MMYTSPSSLAIVAFVWVFLGYAHAANVKALYLFKDPALSNNTAIKTVGFNTVIVFSINVQSNGDIIYPLSALGGGSPDVTLVTNGSYIGGSKYADLITGYKTGLTKINRVEVTTGSASNIQSLINADGIGSSTLLYRNFHALKQAWAIDAINNDDEAVYDVDSTVTFAKMLGTMGYKYTTAPYTNIDFWATVTQQINGNMSHVLDRTYLQCYDGGAGNDPSQWQDGLGMDVIPLLWVTNDAKPYDGSTVSEAEADFSHWYSQEQVGGGGYWNNYDIEQQNSSYSAYANALNEIFG